MKIYPLLRSFILPSNHSQFFFFLRETTEGILDPLNDLIEEMRVTEVLATRAVSLVSQLPRHLALVEKFLSADQPLLLSDPERSAIDDLFVHVSGHMAFALADKREFILELTAPRPHASSRPGTHRLYACFGQGDVRIAETLAEDVTFF